MVWDDKMFGMARVAACKLPLLADVVESREFVAGIDLITARRSAKTSAAWATGHEHNSDDCCYLLLPPVSRYYYY